MSVWKIIEYEENKNSASSEDSVFLSKLGGINPLIFKLLKNRGIENPKDVFEFLNPEYNNTIDPFLFKDMGKFVSRIGKAKEKKEKVCVWADYDADGVCSAVELVEVFKAVGIKEVGVYIPHREKEGYGLNKKAIDEIAKNGTSLIVTVDCGTSNYEEVLYAKKKNLDVIVLDHHEEPERIPEGLSAFLNPHISGETYPFKFLSAAGVAFKAVQALWKEFNLPKGHEKWFLDLVAIATVADMMPLTGENRILVGYGLKVLNKTKRNGLLALIRESKKKIGSLGVYDIGYIIGPRLNAAGRLEHANVAFELLSSKEEAKAKELAIVLNNTNLERQAETDRILKEAILQIEPQVSKNKVLVAMAENWPVGVVGLVSGRITEKFNRPSLVISKDKEKFTGSGRSIKGFNITKALQESSEFLLRFGGHEGACGFTLASESVLDAFVDKINKIASKELSEDDLKKTIAIDAKISFEDLDFDFVLDLERLSPFGMGNPKPKFASFGVVAQSIFYVGSNSDHIKILFSQGKKNINAIGFGMGKKLKGLLNPGDLVDVAFEVEINEWNGNKSLQIKILDIKK